MYILSLQMFPQISKQLNFQYIYKFRTHIHIIHIICSHLRYPVIPSLPNFPKIFNFIFPNIIILIKQKMPSLVSVFLLLSTYIVISQTSIKADLNFPFQLTNDLAAITDIETDYQSNIWIGLNDGNLRKFTPGMQSYANITLPNIANVIIFGRFSYNNLLLTNLTHISASTNIMGTIYTPTNTLYLYDYTTYLLLEQYTGTQTIKQVRITPIKVANNINCLAIIISLTNIKLFYRSTTLLLTSFSTAISTTSTLSSSVFKQQISVNAANGFTLSTVFIVGYSNNNVYTLTIINHFSFNSTASKFDLLISSFSFILFKTHSQICSGLLFTNNVILMQTATTKTIFLYSFSNSQYYTVSNTIPKNTVQQFMYINNDYYLLQNNAIVQIDIATIVSLLIFYSYEANYVITIANLTLNNYRYVEGANFDLLYVQASAYVYKAGSCLGNTSLVSSLMGSSCQIYSCTVANCTYCPISPTICGTCLTGNYRVAQNYTCIVPAITVNATNTTNTNNTPNVTNNLTLNTTGTTNTTPIINTTNTSNTTNPNTQKHSQQTSQSLTITLQIIFDSLNEVMLNTISIPGARKLMSPLFLYFSNFDDLYLYQFHNRLYGKTMTYVFTLITNIQTAKWSIINSTTLLQWCKINPTSLQNFTDYQSNYLSYSFIEGHPYQGSESIMYNCVNFFIVLLPISVVGFVIVRYLFYIIYQFPISRAIRKFGLWGFLIVMLFEGNIQQFSFYLSADWNHLFTFQFGHRLLKSIVLIFGFCLLMISFGGYFLTLFVYKKCNKYLIDNNRNQVWSIGLLIVQNGVRNIVLGVLHYHIRSFSYNKLITTLFIAESTCLMIFVSSLTMNSFYQHKIKIWIFVCLNLLRLVLLLTLWIDFQNINQNILENVQQGILSCMVIICAIGFIHQMTIHMKELANTFKTHLCDGHDTCIKINGEKEVNHKKKKKHKNKYVYRIRYDNDIEQGREERQKIIQSNQQKIREGRTHIQKRIKKMKLSDVKQNYKLTQFIQEKTPKLKLKPCYLQVNYVNCGKKRSIFSNM